MLFKRKLALINPKKSEIATDARDDLVDSLRFVLSGELMEQVLQKEEFANNPKVAALNLKELELQAIEMALTKYDTKMATI